jgi:hypothetical protein
MPGPGKRWLYLTAVMIPIALVAWYYVWSRGPKLTLTIEVTGGFAYVGPDAGDNHLNIAYLNSWKLIEDIDGDGVEDEACNVPQVGTELKVEWGDIVDHEPKSKPLPASREFNLDKAVVRFPALEKADQPLTIVRDKFTDPPASPVDPDKTDHWRNLKWIPSIKEYHAGNVSGTTIHPNWPKMINGRMELRGGEITATTPSIQTYKKARWDFKQNGVTKHTVSVTDKSVYTIKIPMADLPGGNLEITLTDATNGFTRLLLKPKGNRVELKLTGLHAMGAPELNDGDELKDFCTFYQLLQPRPAAKDFLKVYYIKAPLNASTTPNTNALTNSGQPSPGFFCNGDWF